MADQPIDRIKWRNRDELKANNYNPNKVAPPELKLLKTSIIEDGWTQPIVLNPDDTIVDGFHRWTVSGHPEMMAIYHGKVPTVTIKPRNAASQMMSTIRHNRARGTHGVLPMAEIIQKMIADGVSMDEMCARLSMEKEEVVRLANRVGIPQNDIIRNAQFGKAWVPSRCGVAKEKADAAKALEAGQRGDDDEGDDDDSHQGL